MVGAIVDKVSDAISWGGGKFKELSRGAFNQLDIPDPGSKLENFLDTVSNMSPGELVDSVFKATPQKIGEFKSDWADYVAHSAKIITRTAATELGAVLGGPAGVAASELAGSLVEDAIDRFRGKTDKDHIYKQGDWVIVDMGKKNTTRRSFAIRKCGPNLLCSEILTWFCKKGQNAKIIPLVSTSIQAPS